MKKIFVLMLFPLIASGGVMKTIDLQIAKLGKTLSIKTVNGVCEASGPRSYQIAGTASGFSLICLVRGEMTYDSETKRPWGREYEWSTPTSGSLVRLAFNFI